MREVAMNTYKLQRIETHIVRDPAYNSHLKQVIESSNDAYGFVKDLQDEAVEKFVGIFLNQRNRVLAVIVLFSGGTSESVVDPKVVFKTALDLGASGIIIAHNHPSGDPNPSAEDKAITNKLASGARFLDMRILDHLIIGFDKYFSMADEGIMNS
jgi:DNA repair protein RadC